MTARILVIVVALGLAGLTAYLMQNYLTGSSDAAKAPANTTLATEILVADKDLPAGTILNSGHWRWQSWPADSVDKTYETKRKDFKAEDAFGGAAVRRAIGAGEPITKSRVFRQGDKGFLAGALSPGKRAVGIQISAVSSAAGFIRPGDRVDVILTQQLRRRSKDSETPQIKVVSETILSDIRVLAIDQIVDDVDKKAQVGKTATVEVSPKEAEVVTLAARMGQLSLALRSLSATTTPDDRTGMTSDLEVSRALVGGKRATPKKRLRKVLVAGHDLPAGALLRDTDLRWAKPDPSDTSTGHYVEGRDSPAMLRGALLGRSIAAEQPLTSDTVVTPGTPGFIAAALAPGRRAMILDRKAVSGVAGFAAPGDSVDVVLTRRLDNSAGSGHTSETVMRELRILALDSKLGTTALEVTPKQAAALAVIGKMGEISLSLGSGVKRAAMTGSPMPGFDEISPTLAALLAPKRPKQAPEPKPEPVVETAAPRILVALRGIPQGALLRDSDVDWRPIPVVDGTAVFIEGRDKLTSLRGALAMRPISAGTPLVTSAIIKPGTPGFLAAALTPGLRAISIGVDAVSGVSGFVAPNDRVDIILTQEISTTAKEVGGPTLKQRRFSETILRGVRVLAIEQSLDPETGQPVAGRTATIEVSAKDVEVVALAATMGRLSLSLGVRPVGSVTDATRGSFTSDLGVSAAASDFISRGRRSLAPRPPPSPTKAKPRRRSRVGVKLYRGAAATDLKFAR